VTAYRYRAWDGSQHVEVFSASDVMDALARDVLDGGDMRRAVRRMTEQGAEMAGNRRVPGLREMMDRVHERRDAQLERYHLDDVFGELLRRLDEVIARERATVERRIAESAPSDAALGEDTERARRTLHGIAEQRLSQLQSLPPDPGGRVGALRDYDFLDPGARADFDELLDVLQKQMLQQYFEGMRKQVSELTPDDLRATQQMTHDLNEMLKRKLAGLDPEFDDFMAKWAASFPDDIETLDQLLDHLQGRVSEMQSLLRSMSGDQREQLDDLMQALLQDHRLQWDLAEMAALMQQLRPFTSGSDFPFMGDESLSLQDALRVMRELNDIEALERRLRYAQRTNDVTSLDLTEIERLLGEEARWMAERMQEVARVLEDAGLIRRQGNELLLTPRAMRRVGEHALKDIFGNVDAAPAGDHTLTRRGTGLEPADDTKRFTWGDAFGLVDTSRTVMNAVLRDGASTPVRVTPDDFEVRPTLALTQCSTVIMLDMSYSMMQGGRFQAGRRIAIALDSLIRSKYPKDNLYIIAFSYVVLSLKPEQLLDSYWVQYGGGTNFQQALRQARQTLAKHHIGTKQIVFITDGEPTTAYSSWDDDDAVIDPVTGLKRIPDVTEETLREVMRCTQDRITLNTFILDSHPHTGELMRNMARINRGRAFFGSAQDIGKYVLLDYVHNKQHTIR